ncbi:SIS domain-containing protein [Rhizobium alvei]|uniref:SIS domain-containing protein n=1 Tax=Rhizobium alvei TaxID=1132659 RepID=A0ABT8YI83_9HYPH|nr:SIS domain-containing protein [Rhizobium alvei]MDO6963372.1 SIS domain-containing protein [Rhizobium alvei]
MKQETRQAADVVAQMLAAERDNFARLADHFERQRPKVVSTAARGSSDHAATFFKYLFEIMTGYPVASIGPSVASVYETRLHLEGAVHVTVSQSGASPDIVALQSAARRGGAFTVAVVNVTESPLAREADLVIGLHAGPERSVAATKSCLAAAAALAGVTAAITGDAALVNALERLPQALAAATGTPDSTLVDKIAPSHSLYITGRGTGFAVALEAALKAKETCGLHAEAFSLAEVMHGPMRLVEAGFPILAFTQEDAASTASDEAMARLAGLGADIMTIGHDSGGTRTIATPTTGHGLLDALPALAAYYGLIEAVAQRRGLDPDRPRNLSKVTETI